MRNKHKQFNLEKGNQKLKYDKEAETEAKTKNR